MKLPNQGPVFMTKLWFWGYPNTQNNENRQNVALTISKEKSPLVHTKKCSNLRFGYRSWLLTWEGGGR
jgi:hypothetical protein